MFFKTVNRNFRVVRTDNSTDANFPARPDQDTAPDRDGVISLGTDDSYAKFVLFGAGADNSTFTARVLGWKQIAARGHYTPVLLAQVVVTLSTHVGLADSKPLNTERYADTLVPSYIGAGVSVNSNALNVPATIDVDLSGYDSVEVLFDMDTATSGNALMVSF